MTSEPMNTQSDEYIIEQIVEDCYAELPKDWVGLWQIAAYIQDAYPTADWKRLRCLGLRVGQQLLRDPRVRAGRPSTTLVRGFDAWPLTAQASLERIGHEWDVLGRNPNIDEICWFDLEQCS